jgi:serine/threonine protein kinase
VDRTAEAEVILELAMQQPAARREAFLASACARPELLQELTSLLPYAEGDTEFLRSPVPRPVMPDLVKLKDRALRGRAVAELSGLPERIAGFRLVRFLGCGGMGMTFEARQDAPRRAVALKVLHPGPVTPELLQLFESEARLLRRFASPAIVKVFAAGLDQVSDPNGRPSPLPYLAMELVEGEPLDRFSTRPDRSVADRLRVFVRICDAVDHVHQRGVLHLDLKPANVLVQKGGKPKIVDFGIGALIGAAHADATDAPVSRAVLGSFAYMSPERLRGDSPVGVAADVYSLGVILAELLTGRLAGRPPVAAEGGAVSPARFRHGDLSLVAHQATASQPGLRHPSAAALAADVRGVLRAARAARKDER